MYVCFQFDKNIQLLLSTERFLELGEGYQKILKDGRV